MKTKSDCKGSTTMSPFTMTELRMNRGLLTAAILVGGFSCSALALARGEPNHEGSPHPTAPRSHAGQAAGPAHERHASHGRHVRGGNTHSGPGRSCEPDGDTGVIVEPSPPLACQGAAPQNALISDFSDAAPAAPIPFGTVPSLTGGTFSYAAPGLNAPELTLTSGANGTAALHVAVHTLVAPDPSSNYFGFGLYFDSCVDASAYDSIQFTLSGDLGDCDVRFAPTSSENVSIADDPRGACTLASCFPPAYPVSSSGTTRVRFADLLGGSPGLISAASLIGVQWQMNAPDGSACGADFSIDDVTFVDTGVPILPDASGRVEASTNPLGVDGQWHVYGDSYGPNGKPPGVCQAAGHAEGECSLASQPDVTVSGFPNVSGKMCTTGSTAAVLTVNERPDYYNMWGIGIGLSLADPGNGQPAGTYDAQAHRVVGVSFEIDNVPPRMRVEVPTPSDPANFGASYWGANEYYPDSPVQAGTNVVLFRDVHSPDPTAPALDTTQLQQIGFLVSSMPELSLDFSYCISNLKLLVE
jgi:hypothetical protein